MTTLRNRTVIMNRFNAEFHFDCFGFITANTPLFAICKLMFLPDSPNDLMGPTLLDRGKFQITKKQGR